MAGQFKYHQTNFTSGMLGPLGGGRLLGRPDLAKYYNGGKQIRNCLIFKTGGLTRRPGTRKNGSLAFDDRQSRAQRFEFNVEQAYDIEFAHLKIRFWKNGQVIESSPLVPYEIASPYTEDQLFNLTFQQSADVLYIGHESHEPRKLSRVADTNWTLSVINFLPPPAEEKPLVPAATLTLSHTSGDARTFTASTATFLAADADRIIISGAGRAIITTVNSATVVTVDILDPFTTTGPLPAGSWAIEGSPTGELDPTKSRPEGAQITLTLEEENGGPRDGFRAADVGKFIRILGGLVEITHFVDEDEIKGELLNILKDAPSSPRDPNATPAWTLMERAWTADDGFPKAPVFHEDRLLWARRQDVWGSKNGDYENHAAGSADDDAIHYALSTNTVDYLEWLASDDNKLYLGTAGGVHSMTGGGDSDGIPLTPDPPRRRRVVSDRCSAIPPIVVDGAIIFPERSLTLLKEIRFDWEEDKQRAWELTDLNEKILHSGVKQMAYQAVPDPRIWIVRNDGKIVTLTYYRKEDVIGWSMIETDGWFESISITPHSDGDRERITVFVRRSIDGLTRRFCEGLEDKAPEKNVATWPHRDRDGNPLAQLLTDCAMIFTPPAGTTEIANLTHLKGKTVKYFVQNAAGPARVVDENGRITLQHPTHAGDVVEVGIPFNHTIETMPVNIPQGAPIVNTPKRWSTVGVMLLDTAALKVQGQPVTITKGGDPMDGPPPLFTGQKEITDFAITADGSITIEDDLGPFTLLNVYGDLNLGDR